MGDLSCEALAVSSIFLHPFHASMFPQLTGGVFFSFLTFMRDPAILLP